MGLFINGKETCFFVGHAKSSNFPVSYRTIYTCQATLGGAGVSHATSKSSVSSALQSTTFDIFSNPADWKSINYTKSVLKTQKDLLAYLPTNFSWTMQLLSTLYQRPYVYRTLARQSITQRSVEKLQS